MKTYEHKSIAADAESDVIAAGGEGFRIVGILQESINFEAAIVMEKEVETGEDELLRQLTLWLGEDENARTLFNEWLASNQMSLVFKA